MKSLKISALSLVLLLPIATFAAEVPKAKSCTACAKVGEFIGSVRAKLPAMPAMPTRAEAKAAVANAPKAAVAFAKAHPYKATVIVAATAAVVYAVYKVCTAKKANKAKVVVVAAK